MAKIRIRSYPYTNWDKVNKQKLNEQKENCLTVKYWAL